MLALSGALQQDTKSILKSVGPREARGLREHYPFPRQRILSRDNIDRLAAEMAAGRFIPALQIYIAVYPDGSKAILNGNHTLEAIIKSGVSIELTLTYVPVRDEDDAGLIYAVFDSQKVRTWRDALRSTGIAADVRKPEQALPAITIIKHGFRSAQSAIQKVESIQFLEQYSDAVGMFWVAVDGASSNVYNLMKRAGVMAVALAAFKAQPSIASEFWGAIAHDDGLREGMPEKALLNWLRNTTKKAGHVARHEHILAAAIAWNARFVGRDLFTVKPNQIKGDIMIAGTSHRIGAIRSNRP